MINKEEDEAISIDNNNKVEELTIYTNDSTNIFTNRIFKIPIYQRNYEWGEEEIETLIDDLKSFDENKYYFGNLIVKGKNDKDGNFFYEVIDGQQRLTTFYIILKYLGIRNIKENALSFEIRDSSSKTLKILSLKILDTEWESSDYSKEIIKGLALVRDILAKRKKEDKNDIFNNDKLKEKLGKSFMLLVEVPPKTDLTHYFEIMNTRGEQLKQQDIVKARLMDKLKPEDREVFAKIWDACSNMNEYIQMALVPGNTQLRNEIFYDSWDNLKFGSYNYIRNFDALANKLKKRDEINEDYNSKMSLGDLINTQPKTSKKKSSTDIKNENNFFRFESIINFPNFLLHVLAVFRDEKDSTLDEKKLIKAFSDHFNAIKEKHKEKHIKDFAICLLRCKFYFDNYIIKRENNIDDSQDSEWSLLKLKNNKNSPEYINSYKDNKKFLMLQSCMRITYATPNSMHWITFLLKKWCDDWEANDSAIKLLEEDTREKIKKLQDTFDNTEGYDYPHICFTYLDYLLWKEDRVKYGDFNFQYRTSIDHFCPQNPDFDSLNNEDLLHSFGNLSLISVSGNSKFSKYNPKDKIKMTDIINQSSKLILMSKVIAEYTNIQDLHERIKNHNDEMYKILFG